MEEDLARRLAAGRFAAESALRDHYHFVDLRQGRSSEEHRQAVLDYWTPERRAASLAAPMPGSERSSRAPEQQGLGATPGQWATRRITAEEIVDPPYSRMGRLLFRRAGADAHCSAFAIGKFTAATAAHALYRLEERVYAKDMVLDLQYSDGTFTKQFVITGFYMSKDWIARGDVTADYAILTTDYGFYPWMYIDIEYSKSFEPGSKLTILGYPGSWPGDNPGPYNGRELWACDTPLEVPGNPNALLIARSNFGPGASGGPWMLAGSNTAIGISHAIDRADDWTEGTRFDARFFWLNVAATESSLHPYWQRPITATDAPVSVAFYQDQLFAGSFGTLACLDPQDGRIKTSRQFTQHRINLSAGSGHVFLGINGRVRAVEASDIGRDAWGPASVGPGMGDVELCCDDNHVYAVCSNYAARFDADGENIETAFAADEYRPADIATCGGFLFIGMWGKLYSLRGADLTIAWKAELLAEDDVKIACSATHVAAMCGRYLALFRPDGTFAGQISADNPLPHSASYVALSDSHLFVAHNNVLSCFALSNFPGPPIWSVHLDAATPRLRAPIVYRNDPAPVLLVAANGLVLQFDPGTGAIIGSKALANTDDRLMHASLGSGRFQYSCFAGLSGSAFSVPVSPAL